MDFEESRPPTAEVQSDFQVLSAPAAADVGETICRGTHHHDGAAVEREYYRTGGGLLAVETAYVDGDRTAETVEECWLLDGGTPAHTDRPLVEFCRHHHAEEPAADVAFCCRETSQASNDGPDVDAGDVTSTFRPAQRVEVESGAVLRYIGTHEADRARIERSFFVDETRDLLRIETAFRWADERLGSVVECHDLIDGGTFVARTGEPVDAFCRRTHLLDPAVDLRYCARMGTSPSDTAE